MTLETRLTESRGASGDLLFKRSKAGGIGCDSTIELESKRNNCDNFVQQIWSVGTSTSSPVLPAATSSCHSSLSLISSHDFLFDWINTSLVSTENGLRAERNRTYCYVIPSSLRKSFFRPQVRKEMLALFFK